MTKPNQSVLVRMPAEMLAALHAIKARDGVPVNEQLRRAAVLWLESKRVKLKAAR